MNKREVCESKKMYATETVAIEVINYLGLEANQEYYKCDVCSGYHFTATRKTKKGDSKFRDKKSRNDFLEEDRKEKRRKSKPRRKK